MTNLIKENNIPTISIASMSQSDIGTNFLGVKIDTENGSNNPKIRKALDKSFQLLDIMKFIEVTKFKLNMTMLLLASCGWFDAYPGGYTCFRMVWV